MMKNKEPDWLMCKHCAYFTPVKDARLWEHLFNGRVALGYAVCSNFANFIPEHEAPVVDRQGDDEPCDNFKAAA